MTFGSSFNNKNEFSYSYSRETTFKFCKRAYFLTYYASWKGWLDDADKRSKYIYKLKQIKPAEEWIDSIALKAITRALKKEIEPTLSSIKSNAFKNMFSDLLTLQAKAAREDSKKLLIFELYYGTESIASLREMADSRLNSIFQNLLSPEIHTLLERKYLDFISINQISSFVLAGIKVWHSCDLIYHDNDRIIMENIRFKNFRYDHSWHILSSISLIDGLKNLLKFKKQLVPRTKFIYDGRILNVYAFAELSELTRNIIDSSSSMLSLLEKNGEALPENFSKCNDEKKCRTCRFKEACAADFD